MRGGFATERGGGFDPAKAQKHAWGCIKAIASRVDMVKMGLPNHPTDGVLTMKTTTTLALLAFAVTLGLMGAALGQIMAIGLDAWMEQLAAELLARH